MTLYKQFLNHSISFRDAHLSIELVELLAPELPRDDLVQVLRRLGRRSSLALGQLLLLGLPLLDAVRDVDADALGAEVPATDVAGDRHRHWGLRVTM